MRQTQARPGQHQVDEFLTGSLCVSVKLRGWRLPGLFELAVNSQLNAADGQQIDSCFRLARLDGVADPELPFPDVRRRAQCHAVFYALVHHGTASPRLADSQSYDGTKSCVCSILLAFGKRSGFFSFKPGGTAATKQAAAPGWTAVKPDNFL